ncbi:lipopolysaccharide assembly protein LapB [Methylomagnum sp.]
MLELLALLLPVAAASGWYVAKRHYTRRYFTDHARPLTRAYCKGLNYLLHEKTDKAIDAFADILERDYETIETHIALGNLFRRRGEVEKAIEIHEKLVDDASLDQAHRVQASYELGVDYMRAGLFDRAEAVFQVLSQSNTHAKPSLQQLLLIYQQEKDWQKAIACTRQLLRFAKTPRGENVAQFLCELAEESIRRGQPGDARNHLAQALRDDPGCVRASLVQARLEMAAGEYAAALQALKRVESQNPAYLPEILESISLCHERLDKGRELAAYLEGLYRKHGLVEAAVVRAGRMRETDGAAAALDHLLTVLGTNSNFQGLRHAVALMAEPGIAAECRDLKRVALIVNALVSKIPRYRCVECGFSGAELHWRCPSCQHWNSIVPAKGS